MPFARIFLTSFLIQNAAIAAPQFQKLIEYRWIENNIPVAAASSLNHHFLLSESYLVATTSKQNEFAVWQGRREGMVNFFAGISVSPNRELVATVTGSCEISIFDEASGRLVRNLIADMTSMCFTSLVEIHFLNQKEIILRYGRYIKLVDINAASSTIELMEPTVVMGIDTADSKVIVDLEGETVSTFNYTYRGATHLEAYKFRTGALQTDHAFDRSPVLVEALPGQSQNILVLTKSTGSREGSMNTYEIYDTIERQFKSSLTVPIGEFSQTTLLDQDRLAVTDLRSCHIKIYSLSAASQVADHLVEDGCKGIITFAVDPSTKAAYLSGIFANQSTRESFARLYKVETL